MPGGSTTAETVEALRREFQEKHEQTRNDIHDLRGKVQTVLNENAILANEMERLIGNGQPGIIDKLSSCVDALREEIAELRGVAKAKALWYPILATLAAAILGALIAMWFTRPGKAALGVSSNSQVQTAQRADIP